MAFFVEDGSGLPTANAYHDVAFADTHHADRGNAYWTPLSTAVKQACIIRATDYVDKRFGARFRGFRKTTGQALEWPRLSAFDDDQYLIGSSDVPRKLKMAVAEYAMRAAAIGVLAPDGVSPTPAQVFSSAIYSRSTDVPAGIVRRRRERVGPVEVDTSYTTPGFERSDRASTNFLVNSSDIPAYPEADMWIEELLVPTGQVRLVRS